MHVCRLGTFVRCSRGRRSRFSYFFPPSPLQLWFLVFYCLHSSFVLLVWLCSHCPMPKLAEEPEPDKHAAHTSGQICGIFPRRKQLTRGNEHTLLLLQLCHHNYWPKSVPSHHLRVAVFSIRTNWGTVPRSAGLAPLVGKCSDSIPGAPNHCFNELPDCDSAAQYNNYKKKKKNKKPC